jgi:hypothetical protein
LPLTISIAMCTYNGGRFLPMQLQSIAEQRRLPDELIICDDASGDGSNEIIHEFAERVDLSVRVFTNGTNLGSTRNFARAISLCSGDIIALADQDDVWYPHKLERMERAFLESAEVVGAFSDADLVDEDSRQLRWRLWASYAFGTRDQRKFAAGEALKVLVKHPVVTGATMAFRSQFRNLLLPIPPEHVHDSWIAFLLSACGRWSPIAEPLMQYRRHHSQQIGPGRRSLQERMAQARKTGPDFYTSEIGRFRALQQRLETRGMSLLFVGSALEEISQKISHRAHRASLPRARMARIPTVIREVVNGGYWRYSEGWESIAKDITTGRAA